MKYNTTLRLLGILVLCATLASCTGFRRSRQAQIAAQTGNWDDAVAYYMDAVEAEPGNPTYQISLFQAKIKASQAHFEKGKKFHEAEVYERALIEYQQAVQLDPSNQYAKVELDKVRELLAAEREGRGRKPSLDDLKSRTKGARPQPPQLNPRSDEPISLEFPDPTPVASIYRALGRAFGLNVLFDPNLREQSIPIEMRDVTAQDALEILMRAAGHFYKVLDEHTIIIAADTPQNRRAYEDLVVQAFFLSNVDVKDAMTMLRSLIGAKQLATNEQLNAIILRDTADKVKVAERIIQTIDKARAEVVIDVELLQLSTSRIRELGSALSDYSVTQSLDTGGDNVPLRFSDLEFLNQSNWTLTIPNFIYSFVKNNTDAQLLAKPRLRISEGERARLVIGDRVPIPVTSFNTGNTVGGNVVPITSFQYQDVGIQIQIEPRVHHNREVTLQLTIEVSQVQERIQSGGQEQPIIGTRTIESTIRLQDGETNFLAGLIRTDDANSDQGVPGLSDIPIVGRLFSRNRNENRRTDVILTLTPHIVRLPDITEEDLLPIWVGTETNITFRGGSPRVESNVDGPFDGADQASPEEIRQRIRERLQRLPRGLQGVEEPDEKEEVELPSGQDLVPGSAPGSVFGRPEPPPPLDDGDGFEDNLSSLGGIEDPFELDEIDREVRVAELESLAADALEMASTLEASAEPPPLYRLASASASPSRNDESVTLRLVPQGVEVGIGDTFDVVVEARSLQPISHLPMSLSFNPEVLTVVGIESGGFLGTSQEAEVITSTDEPGRIVIGASRLGRVAGIAGSGDVVRITFQAIAEGATGFGFERLRVLDADMRSIGVETPAPTLIEVEGAGAGIGTIPERPDPRGSGGIAS